jgi:outer membrane protein assembly factor BamB
MVGHSGVLYATDGSDLLAYTSSGGLLWRLHDTNGVLALAERLDGTRGSRSSFLHALSVDGRVLWTASIGTTGRSDGLPKLIVDAAGSTYVGTADGKVRIFSDGGALLATLSAGRHKPFMVPSSRLTAIGRLFINGTDGTLRVYGP